MKPRRREEHEEERRHDTDPCQSHYAAPLAVADAERAFHGGRREADHGGVEAVEQSRGREQEKQEREIRRYALGLERRIRCDARSRGFLAARDGFLHAPSLTEGAGPRTARATPE